MQSGRVPDPDCIRKSIRILRACGPDRPVERICQEVLAGLRLNGNELAPVFGLHRGLEMLRVNPLGSVDDQLRIGRDHDTPSCEEPVPDCTLITRSGTEAGP